MIATHVKSTILDAHRDYRPQLNAIRAAASIWVVVYHFRYFSDYTWFEVFSVRKGYLGVDVFFILSGLVIAHVYLRSASQSYGIEKHFQFLGYRFARLWPVHVLMMVVSLIFSPFMERNLDWSSMVDWLSLTFMIRQWFMPEGYAWNTPAWSISAEFFAYALVFPLVVIVVRLLPGRAIGYALFLLGFSLIAWQEFMHGTINVTYGSGPIQRVIGGFFAGTGLYCVLEGKRASIFSSAIVLFSITVFLLSLLGNKDTLSLLAFTVLLAAIYIDTGTTSRILSSSILYQLGEWSYALYLVHIPIFWIAQGLADYLNIHRGYEFCWAVLIISILISSMVHRFVEIPSRSYLRYFVFRLNEKIQSPVSAKKLPKY